MMKNWGKASKKQIDDEFDRLTELLVHQGDVDVLTEMIPDKTKKDFVICWHDEGEDNEGEE